MFKFKVPRTNLGFPGGPDSKESACNAGDLGWEDPLEEDMQLTPVFLSGKSPWTKEPGRLVRGLKESDTTERLSTKFMCAFAPFQYTG